MFVLGIKHWERGKYNIHTKAKKNLQIGMVQKKEILQSQISKIRQTKWIKIVAFKFRLSESIYYVAYIYNLTVIHFCFQYWLSCGKIWLQNKFIHKSLILFFFQRISRSKFFILLLIYSLNCNRHLRGSTLLMVVGYIIHKFLSYFKRSNYCIKFFIKALIYYNK